MMAQAIKRLSSGERRRISAQRRSWDLAATLRRELASIPGSPTKRAFDIFLDCYDKGALVRTTGDIIALSPPLIIERSHIDQLIDILGGAIRRAA